jgi:hypothetical protein
MQDLYLLKRNDVNDLNIDNPSFINHPELIIYPNPGNGSITLRTSATGMMRVEIINSAGENVLVADQFPANAMLDITELPAGIYLVRVYADNFFTTRRLIKN